MQNKTLLFIYPMHGAELAVKLNSAITIKEPSILSIGVYWSATTGFQVSGCPTITHLLAHKNQWFDTSLPMDPLAEFKQLFAKVVGDYQLNSSQIKMCFEANYTASGQHHFTPLVIELLNFIQPSEVILPTETQECRKFVNYWIDKNGYPRLSIGENFDVEQDHYDFSILTSDEKKAIDQLIESQSMQLTFSPPPKFLTISKRLCGSAVRILKTNSMLEVQRQRGDTPLQIDSVLTLDWNTSEAPSPRVFTPASHSSPGGQSGTPLSPIVAEYQMVSTPASHSSPDGQSGTPLSPIVAEYQMVSTPVSHSSHDSQPGALLSPIVAEYKVVLTPGSYSSHGSQFGNPSSRIFPSTGEPGNDPDIGNSASNFVTGSHHSPGTVLSQTDIIQSQFSTKPTSLLHRFFCRPCCRGRATDILSQSERYKDSSSIAPSGLC